METGQGGVLFALHAQDRRPRSPPYSACLAMTSRGAILALSAASRGRPRTIWNGIATRCSVLPWTMCHNSRRTVLKIVSGFFPGNRSSVAPRHGTVTSPSLAKIDHRVFLLGAPNRRNGSARGGQGSPTCHRGDRLTESNCAETSGSSSPWYAHGENPVGSGRPAALGASEPDFG